MKEIARRFGKGIARAVGGGEDRREIHPRDISTTVPCPKCGGPEARIISAGKPGSWWSGRQLECLDCGHRFNG